MSEGSKIKAWFFALKIPSWPKIFTSFFLGQGIGIYEAGFNPLGMLVGFLFCIAGVSFIVLLNDYRDQKVDSIKRELFPDSSLKTIHDGVLSAKEMLIGVFISATLAFSAAIIGNIYLQLEGLFLFSFICFLAFIVYSVPPIQLNYNGGGELMEMIGVGALLPAFSAYLHTGDWKNMELLWCALPMSLFLALSSALASGLSDEESDRKGGKNTFTTMYGNTAVRKTILVVVILSVPAAFGVLLRDVNLWWGILLLVAFVIWNIAQLRKLSPSAMTNQFDAIRKYKKVLHKIIWWGLTWLTLVFIVTRYL